MNAQTSNRTIATIEDVHAAAAVIAPILSPAPLIRSYALERKLALPAGRRVWIKDYGWTPVGSFKLLGALNWVAHHVAEIGERPIVAHSSGNFASGLAFAGKTFGKRVIIIMPEDAPQIKFERTRGLGAEVLTYDKSQDHLTGQRDKLTQQVSQQQQAVQASPYDDNHVIAGNGVGGLEIVRELKAQDRELSHFLCAVSGGGLMAGHALAIADGFPQAEMIAVEPSGADDFKQSLHKGERVRIDHPGSICDGLLSYDVGQQNWPILQRLVSQAVAVPDSQTCQAMGWIDRKHGLRTEPSGAITIAALLSGQIDLTGTGDIVLVLSGRNVDAGQFQRWISND